MLPVAIIPLTCRLQLLRGVTSGVATFQRTGLTPKKPCSRKVPVQRLCQTKFAKILLGQLLAWQSLEEIFLKICFILPVSDFLKVAFLRFRVPGGFGRSGVLDRSGEIFCWQMLRDLAKLLTCCSVRSRPDLQTPLCLQKRIVFHLDRMPQKDHS